MFSIFRAFVEAFKLSKEPYAYEAVKEFDEDVDASPEPEESAEQASKPKQQIEEEVVTETRTLVLERDLISNKHGSVGALYLDGKFICNILEDPARLIALNNDRSNLKEVLKSVEENKIYGKTRIPAGLYDVEIRKDRGRAIKEDTRYQNDTTFQHDGIMELKDVPGFLYIQFHPGNSPEDTLGCFLPGTWDQKGAFVGKSRIAYKRLYNLVSADARNNNLQIKIIDGKS